MDDGSAEQSQGSSQLNAGQQMKLKMAVKSM